MCRVCPRETRERKRERLTLGLFRLFFRRGLVRSASKSAQIRSPSLGKLDSLLMCTIKKMVFSLSRSLSSVPFPLWAQLVPSCSRLSGKSASSSFQWGSFHRSFLLFLLHDPFEKQGWGSWQACWLVLVVLLLVLPTPASLTHQQFHHLSSSFLSQLCSSLVRVSLSHSLFFFPLCCSFVFLSYVRSVHGVPKAHLWEVTHLEELKKHSITVARMESGWSLGCVLTNPKTFFEVQNVVF